MRRSVAALFLVTFATAPVLADPPASSDLAPTVAKMKKVCHPVQGGNPLYPEMKCHMVPVETTASAQPAVAAPSGDTTTQVASRTPGTPH